MSVKKRRTVDGGQKREARGQPAMRRDYLAAGAATTGGGFGSAAAGDGAQDGFHDVLVLCSAGFFSGREEERKRSWFIYRHFTIGQIKKIQQQLLPLNDLKN